jgi:hypothetical protein
VWSCTLWSSADRRDHEILSGETGGRAPFFSRLGYGGNRSPEPFGLESFDPELTTEGLMAERPVEGNAEPRFLEAGRKQVAEKTSPP